MVIGTPTLIGNAVLTAGGTSIAATLTANSENTVFACLTMRSGSAPHPTIFTATDTPGSTYVEDAVDGVDSNQNRLMRASNVSGLDNGESVTVSWTNNGEARRLHVVTVSGLSANLEDSGTDTVTSNGQTPVASVTVGSGNYFLLGTLMQRGIDDITDDADFTQLAKDDVGTSHVMQTVYRTVTGPGTFTYEPTFSANRFYEIWLAAYPEAPVAAAAHPWFYIRRKR